MVEGKGSSPTAVSKTLLSLILVSQCLILEVSSFSFENVITEPPHNDKRVVRVSLPSRPPRSMMGQHFACVTMDWWPSNKCDYGVCPWKAAGVLDVDLRSKRLRNALRGLGAVTLRIGGTQADNITYAVGKDKGISCPDFTPKLQNSSHFFGGCLNESRFQELSRFVEENGDDSRLVFGLNLMYGRDRKEVFYNDSCPGSWDPSNARSLMEFAFDNDIEIYGFELGNEIECLSPTQYAADIQTLRMMIDHIWSKDDNDEEEEEDHDNVDDDDDDDDDEDDDGDSKPRVLATDQLHWEPEFFNELIPLVKNIVDVITWHDYPLGPGYGNPNLQAHIMDPTFHQKFLAQAQNASAMVRQLSGEQRTEIWMGETGGCYNSGHNTTSNAFIDSFWYLQVMAGFAANGHSGFCRQSFIGGNYELVDKETHVPNPDYYSLAIFNRLMGEKVLWVDAKEEDAKNLGASNSVQEQVSVWAHCARKEDNGNNNNNNNTSSNLTTEKKEKEEEEEEEEEEDDGAVVFLLINYGNSSADVILEGLKKEDDDTVTVKAKLYMLTADSLSSRVVRLNGKELALGPNDAIPHLEPMDLEIKGGGGSSQKPALTMPNHSIAFVVVPASAFDSSECSK